MIKSVFVSLIAATLFAAPAAAQQAIPVIAIPMASAIRERLIDNPPEPSEIAGAKCK